MRTPSQSPHAIKHQALPCRFRSVSGMAAFDLDTFLSMAQRSRKWQCPHSMRNFSVHELQTDTWVQGVLRGLLVRRSQG